FAMQGLQSRLSGRVKDLRLELLSVLAYFTARIDFPDDEVPEQDARGQLVTLLSRLMELVASADSGMAYRQGIHTAIVGRPNVGKSSLLNCLLHENRAIVTPVPGTTRDTLEEVVNVQNVPFVLIDTAGITQSKDMVEVLGIERSRQAIESADFVLLVIDSSTSLTPRDREIIDLVEGKVVLVVANKSDMPSSVALDEFELPVVPVSALTGAGINELEKQMVNLVMKGKILASDATVVSNPRHKALLKEAQENLAQAIDGLDTHLPDDFITIDLTMAVNALGQITGEAVNEELLDTIFSQFCIGK
ncbi:MAG: tRNA modification GTPase, partial [Chloroflexi bacterium]|nr:tRNA modification GTPase [Chloroflexota bacterium]